MQELSRSMSVHGDRPPDHVCTNYGLVKNPFLALNDWDRRCTVCWLRDHRGWSWAYIHWWIGWRRGLPVPRR